MGLHRPNVGICSASRGADNGRRLGNVHTELLDMLELPTIDHEWVCSVTSSITGVHSNQDQIWLVKIGEYIGFYVYRRS